MRSGNCAKTHDTRNARLDYKRGLVRCQGDHGSKRLTRAQRFSRAIVI
jgi:hypothetical protein